MSDKSSMLNHETFAMATTASTYELDSTRAPKSGTKAEAETRRRAIIARTDFILLPSKDNSGEER